ncbi:Insulinoma-associated protein 1 [Holothuria leucospilota]|uniref:Insulinoma-associated protein 1 n=1 Tax=Holothuria leucospilota TaxID=206669 RepID=A0A9Q1CIN1_HOLLE|nr:Insulinoma-associated protein 1 [Holothuria leucospilota]
MPRGFLVKRSKRAPSLSYRVRSIDEDCLYDLSVAEPETYSQPFNSPDSGYGHSPCPQPSTPHKTDDISEKDQFEASPSLNSLPSSSPVLGGGYPSSPGLPPTRVSSSAPLLNRPLKRSADEIGRSEPRKVGAGNKPKKPKAARKITFDEDSRSPVHGTIIKQLSDDESDDNSSSGGKTLGLGGDFMCKLCKEQYPDPFSLAQHKCSRIVHVEYRCPECDKVFNCPANLASHRRWHKPRPTVRPQNSTDGDIDRRVPNESVSTGNLSSQDRQLKQHCITTLLGGSQDSNSPDANAKKEDALYQCEQCNKKFRRPANLRKHLQQHSDEEVYPCHYCGKVFGSLINRTKHMFTHAVSGHQPSLETIVKCRVCGLAFGDGVALAQHERRHHSADNESGMTSHLYPCKYCSTIFSSSMSLSNHIDKRHPTEHRRSLLLNVPVRM